MNAAAVCESVGRALGCMLLQYAGWWQVSMSYALKALSGPYPACLSGEVIAGSGATVTGTVHVA